MQLHKTVLSDHIKMVISKHSKLNHIMEQLKYNTFATAFKLKAVANAPPVAHI